MSIRSRLTLITVSAVIAIYAVVGGMLSSSGNSFVRAIADSGPYPHLRVFDQVVSHIVNDYVEKPNLEKVRIGALRGLTDGLDPWSSYMLPVQVKDYKAGKFNTDTVGIVLGVYSGYGYAVTVIPGSPAEKAGIRQTDFIEYIDGHATRDLDLYDMRSLLSGAPGTTVELSVFRRSRSEKIKVTRGVVTNAAPEMKTLESQIGYLKVPVLHTGQAEAVDNALRGALKKGAQKIILDLRGSAGGEINEGVAVANLFLRTGTIAKKLGRGGKELAKFEAKPELAVTDLPLVIIADHTTAGAAEIVAAAIQDNKRGEVIGTRTFGIGSEQELFSLEDGSAFLLTTARYTSPNGKIFITEGVTPATEVRQPEMAEMVTPDDEDDNATQQPKTMPTPSATATPAPTPVPKAEDMLLKKAIEILGNSAKVQKKTA
jgi:carboxyl-terminal processing protease